MEVAGRYVGIDLGKRTYEMCIVDRKGKITRTGGKTDFAGIDRLCEMTHIYFTIFRCNCAGSEM